MSVSLRLQVVTPVFLPVLGGSQPCQTAECGRAPGGNLTFYLFGSATKAVGDNRPYPRRARRRSDPTTYKPKDGLKWSGVSASCLIVDESDAKLSFEAALGRLESIVESMESGEVPLAELLAKFEEGTQLLKVCESRLKDAELKIEQLKKQKDGTLTFEKFEAARED